MEYYSINNLSEFIELTQQNEFKNYYYRGENSKYKEIASSLLRGKIPKHKRDINFYENLINDYYKEIAVQLGELERKNFLAFSQHHGLKTNLIDFTTMPIIALFFACTKVETSKLSKGYIYLINRNNTLDISNIINKSFNMPVKSLNIVEMIFAENSDLIYDFLETYKGINNMKEFKKYVIPTINQYKLINSYGIFSDFPQNIKRLYFWSDQYHNRERFLKNLNLYDDIYLNLLKEYFKSLYISHIKLMKQPFPPFPYLFYKPHYKFDRIKNQEGIFLYQSYFKISSKYEGFRLIKQSINPDIIIEVNNQENIIKELDAIGINRKFIYGDFDNIAFYINKKHNL